ncbi:hypothetical protein [Ligilactobacillus equi]|uniref:Uncharacterized protein n=1 Tax=Ligilactobacillus equi DSM 15833 = JCM 10991 TaxID=1423740 RepID=A0A0R1TDN3_9LACO|nr:hypothetical protein [Ligilactobacillus equi]KRL76629.1 hypothetical protein FC36_GL001868 [Ligilactobacillus equi DSM 15833 = JCM 10991]
MKEIKVGQTVHNVLLVGFDRVVKNAVVTGVYINTFAVVSKDDSSISGIVKKKTGRKRKTYEEINKALYSRRLERESTKRFF